MEELKYPIGQFEFEGEPDRAQVEKWVDEIEILPAQLRQIAGRLSTEQLHTPYRPRGWTVSQVVHHLWDSHIHSYVRFKLALTEERPVIKTYYEDRWAKLGDYEVLSVENSLDFLEILHKRWVVLLRSLADADLKREFVHPESGVITVGQNVGIYAWHGTHHLAHVTSLCKRMKW